MILLGNLVFSLLQSYIFAVKSTLLRDINWVLFYNKTQYSIICPKEMFTQTGGKLSYTRQGRWGETHLCIRRLLSGSLNSRIESFAKLEVVTVWFPVPQVTVETILEVLNSQNSGLHTSQWRVISSIACRGTVEETIVSQWTISIWKNWDKLRLGFIQRISIWGFIPHSISLTE